jgi:hypothetical protein
MYAYYHMQNHDIDLPKDEKRSDSGIDVFPVVDVEEVDMLDRLREDEDDTDGSPRGGVNNCRRILSSRLWGGGGVRLRPLLLLPTVLTRMLFNLVDFCGTQLPSDMHILPFSTCETNIRRRVDSNFASSASSKARLPTT